MAHGQYIERNIMEVIVMVDRKNMIKIKMNGTKVVHASSSTISELKVVFIFSIIIYNVS